MSLLRNFKIRNEAAQTEKPVMLMNRGEGEASYARNSNVQNAGQNRLKPLIQEAVTNLWKSTYTHSRVVIADLGCSSGPNALTLVKAAVDAMFHYSEQYKQTLPELCVQLNDLPDNDFNNVVKSLVTFQQSTQYICPVLTGIVPGSFYKRLFTSNSLHLVLSANSLNWLSEVPNDLKKNKIPMYDNDDDIRRARRPLVVQAYCQQFRKDFTLFLKLRAQELIRGGQMVLSLVGRLPGDLAAQSIQPWDIAASPLNDMASRGVISRELFNMFYIPVYGPSGEELKEIIDDEGSFAINDLQVHELTSGMDKGLITPRMRAYGARAAFEPIILQHFGQSGEVMDEFARTVEKNLSARILQGARAPADNLISLCISLTKTI